MTGQLEKATVDAQAVDALWELACCLMSEKNDATTFSQV